MERLRRAPRAYTLGSVAMVVGVLLLAVSLRTDLRVVNGAVVSEQAPPGRAEVVVALDLTSLFQASLVFGPCGLELYLLSDSEYADYGRIGTLPAPTLDCMRTEAVVPFPVRHIVTGNGGTANASYAISAAFLGFIAPYALLSIPGTALALGATVWISTTILGRGVDRLREDFRRLQTEQKAKKK